MATRDLTLPWAVCWSQKRPRTFPFDVARLVNGHDVVLYETIFA
jgi:hypothetical protein